VGRERKEEISDGPFPTLMELGAIAVKKYDDKRYDHSFIH